jgi:hypothetical protein
MPRVRRTSRQVSTPVAASPPRWRWPVIAAATLTAGAIGWLGEGPISAVIVAATVAGVTNDLIC